jgi:hypothetical protein
VAQKRATKMKVESRAEARSRAAGLDMGDRLLAVIPAGRRASAAARSRRASGLAASGPCTVDAVRRSDVGLCGWAVSWVGPGSGCQARLRCEGAVLGAGRSRCVERRVSKGLARRWAQVVGAADLAVPGDGIGVSDHLRAHSVARGLGWQSRSYAPSLKSWPGKRLECYHNLWGLSRVVRPQDPRGLRDPCGLDRFTRRCVVLLRRNGQATCRRHMGCPAS